jgi:hypothetical protein
MPIHQAANARSVFNEFIALVLVGAYAPKHGSAAMVMGNA